MTDQNGKSPPRGNAVSFQDVNTSKTCDNLVIIKRRPSRQEVDRFNARRIAIFCHQVAIISSLARSGSDADLDQVIRRLRWAAEGLDQEQRTRAYRRRAAARNEARK